MGQYWPGTGPVLVHNLSAKIITGKILGDKNLGLTSNSFVGPK